LFALCGVMRTYSPNCESERSEERGNAFGQLFDPTTGALSPKLVSLVFV